MNCLYVFIVASLPGVEVYTKIARVFGTAEDYFGGGGFLHTGNFLTQAQQPSGPQLSLIPVKIG